MFESEAQNTALETRNWQLETAENREQTAYDLPCHAGSLSLAFKRARDQGPGTGSARVIAPARLALEIESAHERALRQYQPQGLYRMAKMEDARSEMTA